MSDLTRLPASELQQKIAAKAVSPVELMKAVLARAEKLQPAINAFTRVDGREALQAARASERRWKKGEPLSPLDGVPVSIDFVKRS